MQRSDDTVESIRNRFEIYHYIEQDILKYYSERGLKPSIINADRFVEEIFEDVKKIAGIRNVC